MDYKENMKIIKIYENLSIIANHMIEDKRKRLCYFSF